MKKLLSYNNDPLLKEQLLAEIKKHEEADAILQGTYGEEENGKWRGCAVGCSLRSLAKIKGEELNKEYSDHKQLADAVFCGEEVLAYLEDRLFEGLDADSAKTFPYRFAEAIPVGVDLVLVWPKFAVWLLTDEQDGVIQYAKTNKEHSAIQNVADLYSRFIGGREVTNKEWRTVAYAAYAATAATAASDASDASDAYTTAAAAAAADANADADAATYAAYAADAVVKENHYKKMSEKLLELLRTSK